MRTAKEITSENRRTPSRLIPRVGVIGGKGIMGSQFAQWFKGHGAIVEISDKGTSVTNTRIAKTCDIVCVSVPMDVTEKVIREVTPHLKKDALICDLTSIKEMPCRVMSDHDGEVLGMHPMFGKVVTMEGKAVILCPVRAGKWTRWIKDAMEDDGIILKTMKPREHDEAMAIVQGLVHAADIAFMHTLRDLKIPIKKLLPIASLASEMKIAFAARLIAQDARLYANIQISQQQNAVMLQEFQRNIGIMIGDIKAENRTHAEKFFEEAKNFARIYATEALAETDGILELIAQSRKNRKKSQTKNSNTTNAIHATWGVFRGEGSHTDDVFKRINPSEKSAHFSQSIPMLLRMLKKRQIKYAMVPAENSTFGTIRETLDTIANEKLHITAAYTMPIHHCLYIVTGKKSKFIKTIASHAQAIKQCEKFLEKHYVDAEIIKMSSTAEAMRYLKATRDPTLAVIAQKNYMNDPQYACLHKNIEDEKNNTTTFYMVSGSKNKDDISSKEAHGKAKRRTTIVFDFRVDRPGNLEKVFQIFAENGVNLTRIESRPNPKKIGQYFFFLDAEANKNIAMQKALSETRKLVRFFHEAGPYEVTTL